MSGAERNEYIIIFLKNIQRRLSRPEGDLDEVLRMLDNFIDILEAPIE